MHVEGCMPASVCIYLCVFLGFHVIACCTRDCVKFKLYLEDHWLSPYIATSVLTTAVAENISSPASPQLLLTAHGGLHVGMAPGVPTPFSERTDTGVNSQRSLSI